VVHVSEDESVLKRLEKIESMLRKYMEDEYLQYIRKILGSYFRLIEIYMKDGRISPASIFPEIKDEISRDIVEILFLRGSMNTTEITRELRNRRGSASRRIVRERLQTLVDRGVLDCVEKKSEKEYMVSEHAMRRWLKVLGIDIRSESPDGKR